MEEAAKLVSGSVLAPSSLCGAEEAGTKAMLRLGSAGTERLPCARGPLDSARGCGVAEARARSGTQCPCRTAWPTSHWLYQGLGAQGKGVEMSLGEAHRVDFLEEVVLT